MSPLKTKGLFRESQGLYLSWQAVQLGKQCSTTGVDLHSNTAGSMRHPSTRSVPVSGILLSIVIPWPKCLLAAKVLLALVSFKRNMELLDLETTVHCEPKHSKWGLFKDQECIPGPFWTRSKLQQQKMYPLDTPGYGTAWVSGGDSQC